MVRLVNSIFGDMGIPDEAPLTLDKLPKWKKKDDDDEDDSAAMGAVIAFRNAVTKKQHL